MKYYGKNKYFGKLRRVDTQNKIRRYAIDYLSIGQGKKYIKNLVYCKISVCWNNR